jgi:hypothetical protein
MSHAPFAMSRAFRRSVAIATATLPLLLAACEDEEEKTRKRIVADYVREIDMRPRTPIYVRQVLTLRPDSRWTRITTIERSGTTEDTPADSGTFRIQGVTLVLRSLVSGGEPRRFTIGGDSLFSGNAAQVHALTGHDIGEEIFVRTR